MAVTSDKVTVNAIGYPQQVRGDALRWARVVFEANVGGTSVFLGGANVNATDKLGIELAEGETWIVEDVDLSEWYVDADTTGDGVSYTAWR